MRRQPAQRRREAFLVQHRRAQFELQRAQFVDRLVHELEARPAGARRRPMPIPAECAELHLRDRQLLHRAVVEFDGEAPALAFLHQRQVLREPPEARVGSVQSIGTLSEDEHEGQRRQCHGLPEKRVIDAVLVADRNPLAVDAVALGGRDRVDGLLQDAGQDRPIIANGHAQSIHERRLAGDLDLSKAGLPDVVARRHQVADERERLALRDRPEGLARVAHRQQREIGPLRRAATAQRLRRWTTATVLPRSDSGFPR